MFKVHRLSLITWCLERCFVVYNNIPRGLLHTVLCVLLYDLITMSVAECQSLQNCMHNLLFWFSFKAVYFIVYLKIIENRILAVSC